ncbi:unnamed protein product [Darwinula stevensoni]|uniref:Uncharacterized protein n=1 Tax=Darwinula stevensoni TaxID=69355 RepID=A0A7R9ACD1_9CRUS|nr:unnamed protein product [Darwinula stevensoni]CAG0900272.1 unnamed protein product [Darwinula stevensoni]
MICSLRGSYRSLYRRITTKANTRAIGESQTARDAPSGCIEMDDADFAAWKRFHERREVWMHLAKCAWFMALSAMIICFAVGIPKAGFVIMAFLVVGPFTVLQIPFLIDSFDRRYRKPRCLAAGVDPQLYMLPNVPYLLVEKGSIPTTGLTWHVEVAEEGAVGERGARRIKCRVDWDALGVIRGKSWRLETIVPKPDQGKPPFVLKSCSWIFLSSLDAAVVVLTDSPGFLPFHCNLARRTHALPPYPEPGSTGPSLGPILSTLSSGVDHPQESSWNTPLLPPDFPATFHSEPPPSYDEAIKVPPHY